MMRHAQINVFVVQLQKCPTYPNSMHTFAHRTLKMRTYMFHVHFQHAHRAPCKCTTCTHARQTKCVSLQTAPDRICLHTGFSVERIYTHTHLFSRRSQQISEIKARAFFEYVFETFPCQNGDKLSVELPAVGMLSYLYVEVSACIIT
jgi:hypothetical protein